MSIFEKYKGKKIAILGYGVEGKATLQCLKDHGLAATVIDKADGDDYLSNIRSFEVIFRSPGISPLTPELVEAVRSGVTLTSQTEEFLESCPCTVIGVTGTKGKGTTSTLVYQILKNAGRRVFLGGNIGTPALTFLDQLTANDIVVLELSSFQLQGITRSPQIAVLLNTTSEHLDYHKDTKEYREAKANILRFQTESDTAIINGDYDVPGEMSQLTKGRKLYFSRNHSVEGCYVNKRDELILNLEGKQALIGHASEMQLRGRHNLENITAASLAATVVGVSLDVIKKTIKEFTGLEHRLEFVAEIDGVKYYNDSFSTVPETAIAALSSFSEPIVLIAGGSSKNSDYTELGKVIGATALRALILIGDTANEIESKISPVLKAPIILNLEKMSDIVMAAQKVAKPGDIVLLSPACASFGLFENYKDRGNKFKSAVYDLMK